ncbi:MAG: hypothetical protein NWS18_04305 [Schleiferiaceae bacterium]|nr:hypothetical protein [Schleiferiaceae bacterium]MDP4626731.1 hypothetical protein [Schleiferiaceae bacterium]MDP4728842.1 hypothetical protein [Schleiferiaceae bacterium]MDP4749864.1 hypothetical protein [Schleiferiaceae bacterium]MDP4860038.1 hypothetical protein [Schleiferiaceae bacterium]
MMHLTHAAEAELLEVLEPVLGEWLAVRALSGTDKPLGTPTLDDLDLRILRAFQAYPRVSSPLRSGTAV